VLLTGLQAPAEVVIVGFLPESRSRSRLRPSAIMLPWAIQRLLQKRLGMCLPGEHMPCARSVPLAGGRAREARPRQPVWPREARPVPVPWQRSSEAQRARTRGGQPTREQQQQTIPPKIP
jgi:hypothetical protein